MLCLPAVLVSLSLVGGACANVASPPAQIDNLSTTAADAALTPKFNAGLQAEDSLKKSAIDVPTRHSVVTLEGAASSPDAKSTAGAATLLIEVVKDVDNVLATSNPCTPGLERR